MMHRAKPFHFVALPIGALTCLYYFSTGQALWGTFTLACLVVVAIDYITPR
jgi:hypothetical protein